MKLMAGLLFAAIVSVVCYLIYVLPVYLMLDLLAGGGVFRLSGVVIAGCLGLPVLLYLRTHMTSPLLRGLTHYGMGFGFIGLCVFAAGQLAAAFLSPFQMEIGMLCLAVFVMVGAKSILNGRHITTKELQITSARLNAEARFIFISDVHLGSNPQSHLERIIEMITPHEYDALLIGGDLFDASSFQPETLTPLRQLDKPIYFVTGNHEYYVKGHQDKLAALGQYNITMLDNEAIQLAGIHLIGISDNQNRQTQTHIASQLIQPQLFNFVLVHQPGIWEMVPENTDFMCSGHTHNGQIFPFNWLVRLQFSAVYGLYQRGGSRLYVSSGAGTWGPRMRLGTRNEIVRITFSPE